MNDLGWMNNIIAQSNGHKWIQMPRKSWLCCQTCGIVRRSDDKNKPCPGEVKVRLKDILR